MIGSHHTIAIPRCQQALVSGDCVFLFIVTISLPFLLSFSLSFFFFKTEYYNEMPGEKGNKGHTGVPGPKGQPGSPGKKPSADFSHLAEAGCTLPAPGRSICMGKSCCIMYFC